MDPNKMLLLEAIKERAQRDAMLLAGELLRAPAEEKEAIVAGLEFEAWLARSCDECLRFDPGC
jgi:hypothetical protein